MINNHDAVAAGLIANGITASVEFPGCVVIEVDADTTVWTGLHSWAYGSIYRQHGESTDDTAQVPWTVDHTREVEAIVTAWTQWVHQHRSGNL